MLERRLNRKREGGDESVFNDRWNKQVVPAYRNFIRPTKAHADYVINNNKLSLDEFRKEVRNVLEKSEFI